MKSLSRRALPGQGWDEAEESRIIAALQRTSGLTFPTSRLPLIERGIRRTMAEHGFTDLVTFREAIDAGGPARATLLTELTIGETYFFRERSQLEFIVDEILPAAARSAGWKESVLRVWSAGCATGEEPYSIAMMLRDREWATPVEIVGTDVSLARLAAAKRGTYTEWSLRVTSQTIRERHFEEQHRQHQLRTEIRNAARFEPMNLAADDYPSMLAGTRGADVILCRNVLIYFDEATVSAVAKRLLAALAPEGWLLLSATDPVISAMVPCQAIMTSGGLAYRRHDAPRTSLGILSFAAPPDPRPDALPALPPVDDLPDPASAIERAAMYVAPAITAPPPPTSTTIPETWAPAPPAVADVEAAYTAADYDRVIEAGTLRIKRGDDDERTHVLVVRALANQGQLELAAAACTSALERYRESAELYVLQGVLFTYSGLHGAAARAARRALYLDRSMIVAHMLLSDALAAAHDELGAQRALHNAERLLAPMPDEMVVPAADGETAGHLLRLIRHRMKTPSTLASG
jgi:chemotaxis protein methyltransferase CheR